MDGRQMDGQAKNNRAPPTRWRGPKYILGHTDVLINDKHDFCECQYLYILRQKKITITLTYIKLWVIVYMGPVLP